MFKKKMLFPTLIMVGLGILLSLFGFNLTGGVLLVYAVILNLI